jgi:hypothetical protein
MFPAFFQTNILRHITGKFRELYACRSHLWYDLNIFYCNTTLQMDQAQVLKTYLVYPGGLCLGGHSIRDAYS